jgi:hypothetical protein
MYSINVETGRGAIESWHDQDSLRALVEGAGKRSDDERIICVIPKWLAALQRRLDENLVRYKTS